MVKKLSALTLIFSLLACNVFAQPQNLGSSYIDPKVKEDEDIDEFEGFETNRIEIYDPYEKINRHIFSFNESFDRYFFEHVARAYRYSVPSPVRRCIGNFLNNLNLPISAVNSFAQGKVDNGLATISNFIINTTIGIGGIFNVAGKKGIIYKNEDFGQTIGHYVDGSGAYLMIPFLGPSSTRDFSGFIVDKSVSPIGFNLLEFGGETDYITDEYRFALTAITAIDIRTNLIDIVDDVRKESFDPYATMRSAYLQKRAAEIKN